MSEETVPLWKKIARFRIKAKKAALGTDRRALNEATDIIESQATELSALRERVKELEGMIEKVDDLISESVGVEGLHMNGDIATWEWLKNNEWLEGFDDLLSTRREEL